MNILNFILFINLIIELLPRYKNSTGLEFDIFFPSFQLALEFQGIQHYEEQFFTHGREQTSDKAFEYRKTLDTQKLEDAQVCCSIFRTFIIIFYFLLFLFSLFFLRSNFINFNLIF